ncbi:MAG: hypothetical protein ABJA76_09595 [Mucilaginibacter sp.]
MTLEQYIQSLQNIKPSEKKLLQSGFTEVPLHIIKNYVLEKKGNADINHNFPDSLIFNLFNTYDTWYLRFADFTFNREIVERDGLFIFGDSSSSELCFKSFDSEVMEIDHDEHTVLEYCAKDTESFLKALLFIFELYALRFQNLADVGDDIVNQKCLNDCVEAAGGIRYKRFYRDIIG